MNEVKYEGDANDPAYMLARNLASLVCTKQRPVVFDLITVSQGYVPCPPEARPLSEEEVEALSPAAAHKRAKAMTEYKKGISVFVEWLADVMTVDDVQAIAPCYLAEIGHTDCYPELGEAWVFIVAPLPKSEDVYVMDI